MVPSTELPKRLVHSLAVILAVLVGFVCTDVAGQTLGQTTAVEGAIESSACVLLRNDQVLFGTAEQQGDWIVVRNGQGNQVRLLRSQVACWADSPRDLYQYRVDHRRSGDPLVHLQDARWCLRYRLLDLAAAELREVYRIVPNHPEAAIIESQLRSALGRPHHDEDAREQIAQAAFVDEPFGDTAADDAQDGDYSGGLDSQSFHYFVRHVHPLLLNRCGGCHSHTSNLDWQLIVPSGRTRASARITRENLRAVLPLVRFGELAESDLLRQAIQPHGGEKAPLHLGDEKAIGAIRTWIQHARFSTTDGDNFPIGSVPFPIQAVPFPIQAVPSAGFASSMEVTLDPDLTEWKTLGTTVAPGLSTIGFSPPGMPELEPREAVPLHPRPSGQPSRLPAVDNPFDPELFNRRYHRP